MLQTAARHSLLCVSVPAESPWAKEFHHRKYQLAHQKHLSAPSLAASTESKQSLKRPLEDSEDGSNGAVDMETSPKKPAAGSKFERESL